MNDLKSLFGHEKPIIALLHIRELPGDPFYPRGQKMDKVVDCARQDLQALQAGGVDAVLFSNEYSQPYQPKVDPVTVGAMGYVIGALREEITVPFGVHVISDAMATIELAAAVNADFVRSVFTGSYAGEMGLRSLDIAAVLRRKMALGLDDLKLFYMVGSESDGDVSGRNMADTTRAIVFKCSPDALCVSGKSAGSEAESNLLDKVRQAAGGVPVLCNTGVNIDNVRVKLACCDGAFIGTSFKKDGVFENMVDGERVKRFMELVNTLRGV